MDMRPAMPSCECGMKQGGLDNPWKFRCFLARIECLLSLCVIPFFWFELKTVKDPIYTQVDKFSQRCDTTMPVYYSYTMFPHLGRGDQTQTPRFMVTL
jgi:hypothetical protein